VQKVQIKNRLPNDVCGKTNEFRLIGKRIMAELELQFAESKKTKRKLHPSLRMDMTPMVDLGFLLITFFIFTTTMSENRVMKLFMPTNKGDSTELGKSKVLTVLLGQNNKAYVYEGKFEDAVKENKVNPTTYNESDGIGDLIRRKQKQLQETNKEEGKDALVFLIKPTAQSSYKNVIDALDETMINGVKKYMIVDASAEEKSHLQKISQ
jgi:biopolymer transport protein ExbD